MTIARTSILKKFAMAIKGVKKNMCVPPALKHLSGLALANDKFDDEVAAHSDHHHDHSNDHEDHDECTDKYLEEVCNDHQGRGKHVFSPYPDAPLRPRALERRV